MSEISSSPSQSFDPASGLMEVYECAKNCNNWNKILSSLIIHPEWLIKYLDGHSWTILHQIVYFGNVIHLNEVLALQTANPQFRLLCKTLDNKTVREIAADGEHLYPEMKRRIERLVILDQLLNHAKTCEWDSLAELVREQPDIVNEKPPYRRFYLAHHLAYMGELNIFKNLSDICQFKLDLLVDNKTIDQIARENNHIEFAEYIERLIANNNDNPTTMSTPSYQNDTTQQEEPNDDDNESVISESTVSQMNDEQIDDYEKTVTNNLKQISEENLLNAITCCITKSSLRDPVMAADGFTYEREAILKWFEQCNRSPMTNQELDNLEVKPNYAIKSLLEMLNNTKK